MNNNPTILEINLSSVEHNLQFFRSKLDDKTKILAVVKASGYGTDAIAIAKTLAKQQIDYFAVAYIDEGIALREAGIETPILVLHPQLSNLELIVQYKLEPNLYSKKILTTFLKIAVNTGLSSYPIHLKFNTGLNRLGFKKSDLRFLFTTLQNEKSIEINSIFSHLVASEDINESAFSLNQIQKFISISDDFKGYFGFKPMMHMTNTSGILNFPEAHFDMVRLGIGLYGFANDLETTLELKNVISLKSLISQIHHVEENESVGYNRGFLASEEIKTATVPIGHADGLFRSLGQGKVFVSVNGQKAPIIGNVCMDMIMIDITGISCEEGDEVIIFDTQKQVLEMARQANTISYEILTTFSERIKRVAI
jgi:alanine racemase